MHAKIVRYTVIVFLLPLSPAAAGWDPANREAALAKIDELDGMLHVYLAGIGKLNLQHYDKDFAGKVHEIEEQLHVIEELLKKDPPPQAAELLAAFANAERECRAARGLFTHLARTVHGNREAGLGWLDFLRQWEEFHFLMTGRFSWQEA